MKLTSALFDKLSEQTSFSFARWLSGAIFVYSFCFIYPGLLWLDEIYYIDLYSYFYIKLPWNVIFSSSRQIDGH